MIKVDIKLVTIMSLVFFIVGCKDSYYKLNNEIDNVHFSVDENLKKEYMVGKVTNRYSLDLGLNNCSNEPCIDPKQWFIYRIEGYFLPSSEELITIEVAHFGSGGIISTVPWIATLQAIEDKDMQDKLNVDYLLVGVDLGFNIFCPDKENKELFKGWEFKIRHSSGTKCVVI
ncbi:hypothetical protein [Kangiella sp. HZ709]|uniref:hypothetical protein n=1 Tax=Kangiella sp. HZ709 TaxID=2666328 RepID=UPI0012B08E80|nr:hypothetical protein [Kangiella sp. HZ709]MRX27040.1 hypothetical protein [Kangiella sp. HZ709]